MPLDELIDRILKDARERAEQITLDALKQRDRILADADREAEESYTRIVNAARRAAEENKKHRVTMAALDARKGVLEEKQRLIREVHDRALEAMQEMPEEQYIELLVRLLAAVTGDQGGELILSPEDRKRAGQKVVSRANKALEKGGKKGRLALSAETRDISGGFVLRTEGVEINNSLGALITSRREETEPRVVEILFGENG